MYNEIRNGVFNRVVTDIYTVIECSCISDAIGLGGLYGKTSHIVFAKFIR